MAHVQVYLHERVTVQGEGSTGDLLEALADVGQRASSQDLRLVVGDESQGHAEKNLGALVEKTIPDPQDCLQATEMRCDLSSPLFRSVIERAPRLTSIGRMSI